MQCGPGFLGWKNVLFQQNKDTYEPFCKVPVITSSKEEQKLIATSNKVRWRHPCGISIATGNDGDSSEWVLKWKPVIVYARLEKGLRMGTCGSFCVPPATGLCSLPFELHSSQLALVARLSPMGNQWFIAPILQLTLCSFSKTTHSPLWSCCTTEVTTNTHIPGKASARKDVCTL